MRSNRWLVLAAAALTASVASVSGNGAPALGYVTLGTIAQAQDIDIKVGANLLAVQSISLDDAIIAIGERVSVVGTRILGGAVFLDVSLTDGHVVKSVPIDSIRKSFRVVG